MSIPFILRQNPLFRQNPLDTQNRSSYTHFNKNNALSVIQLSVNPFIGERMDDETDKKLVFF